MILSIFVENLRIKKLYSVQENICINKVNFAKRVGNEKHCVQLQLFKEIHSEGLNWLIGLVGRVFANVMGNLGSVPGRIIPKTLKIVLDTSLLNTQ